MNRTENLFVVYLIYYKLFSIQRFMSVLMRMAKFCLFFSCLRMLLAEVSVFSWVIYTMIVFLRTICSLTRILFWQFFFLSARSFVSAHYLPFALSSCSLLLYINIRSSTAFSRPSLAMTLACLQKTATEILTWISPFKTTEIAVPSSGVYQESPAWPWPILKSYDVFFISWMWISGLASILLSWEQW